MSAMRPMMALAMLSLASVLFAQDAETLTLPEALDLARENNGTVRSAFLNYEVARANARGAYSAYLPTVFGSVGQVESQLDTFTGPFRGGDRSC